MTTASNDLTASMTSSLAKDLIRDEGVRTKPYRDSRGFLTIGVGHNLDSEGLCQAAVDAQLDHDIRTKAYPLYQSLPWLVEHPEPVQRALLNMAFNVGVHKLLTFKETLELIRLKQYAVAADHILRLPYASQVGSRASRIADLLRSVV